jgi:hypothetical protein
MPFSSGKTTLALLFAILTSSCASQNAMSLVPDSVRLDMVREKAAKASPVSVDEMLDKARAHTQSSAEKSTATATALDTDPIGAELALAQPRSEEGYPGPAPKDASKPKDPLNLPEAQKSETTRQEATRAAITDTQNNQDEQNAREMFRVAQEMHGTNRSAVPEGDSKPEAQWRQILEQAQLNSENEIDPETETAAFYADADRQMTTAALPPKTSPKGETVAITFDDTLLTLSKDDDLRVRLLRHGNRHPETIIIGKVENIQGFAAMQKALELGKIIADASGGTPGISYDPALPPRTAELHYAKPGTAQ